MKHLNIKAKFFSVVFTCAFIAQFSVAQTVPVISEKFGQARVCTKGDSLFVNTGEVERIWVWTGNGLVTTSLKNVLTGKIYRNSQKNVQCDWMLWDPQIEKDKKKGQSTLSECDWNWQKADAIPLHAKLESLTVAVNDDEGFTNKYIEVVSRIRYELLKLEVQHVIWVYPNSPGIRTQLRIKAMPGFQPDNFSKNDTVTKYYGGTLPIPGGRTEFLPLDFSEKNQRDYWGYYNDPGNRHDQSMDMLKEEVVQGYPLFQIESNNWASGIGVDYGKHGVCVIKESPKTVNQQGHNTGSFYSGSNGLWITGLGLLPAEVTTDRFRECWANWTILYSGNNDNLQLAVKRFDRARYPAFAERDLFILGNTWGPGDPLGNKFTEKSFVMKEIPALAKIGVDVMQIDDGWQKSQAGMSARDFLPKYTNGWKDIKAEGDKYGVKFGLWVSIQNAKVSDLKTNIDQLGFVTWKADFDHLANRKDFEDRTKSYREVMRHTWMKSQFTLCPEYDNLRYGWYYAKEYGSIYFQNIQEALPEHLTMVPYHVLRQHWLMSKYFNSNKLQVMLQNPKRTNKERSDAFQHSHSYCFAMGLPFIPCFFQSAQFLDDEGQKEMKQLIAVYKKYREDMFKCYTYPIGDMPSNDSWSGFQMVNEKAEEGYLLLFREMHNTESQKRVALKFLSNKTISITNLENGKVSQQKVSAYGDATFLLKDPASYLFLKYSVKEKQLISR
jgi:hypothetical protein